MPEIVIGINYSHDSSACLIIDGIVVSACEEERFTGFKHQRGFPINSVQECLDIANISIEDVDIIATPLENPQFNSLDIKKKIKRLFSFNGKIHLHSHHLCHLSSAYYSSGFKDSLIYSLDGIGGEFSSMSAFGLYDDISIIHSGNSYPESLGLFYSAVTDYLGWKHHYDEGIVMGLAGIGNPDTYIDIMRDIVISEDGQEYQINKDYITFHKERDTWVSDKFISHFGERRLAGSEIESRHADIASALQLRLEEVVLEKLTNLKRQKPLLSNLCLAGGVFMNCSLNGRIVDSGLFGNIYVCPASSDNGNAIGAAYLSSQKKNPVSNMFLGSRFSDEYISNFCKDNNFHLSDNIYSDCAKLLSQEKIICWFNGATEFGARALGNRSILSSPFPFSQKKKLNDTVKFREGFRPFAPSVMNDYSSDFFCINSESPNMTVAYHCKEKAFDSIPATVHSNKTSRVQTVTKIQNPHFYNLLSEFNSITGVPVLLNTSFNIKGQPIVNSPEQALGMYLNSKVDGLIIGDFIIK